MSGCLKKVIVEFRSRSLDRVLLRLFSQCVEWVMVFRITKYLAFLTLFFYSASFSSAFFAKQPTSDLRTTNKQLAGASQLKRGGPMIDIDIYVMGADGGPIEVTAMVTLVAVTGQVFSQGTTVGGNIKFKGLAASPYTIQVVAPGYESVAREFDGYREGASRIIIDMRPAQNGKTAASSLQILLAPKAQKELGKALEALRANRPEQARSHLEAVYRTAPSHPAVNYLFGVYFLQIKDQERAMSYWAKTLQFDPKHVSALLSLGEALMREQKLPEAQMYVTRAVEADPSSWRAHAILADVFLQERFTEDAIKEADRALQLGHGQAAIVQPVLALALVESGNKVRAARVLEQYLQDHPRDAATRNQLERLQAPELRSTSDQDAAAAEVKPTTAIESAIALPLPSNWLPPDVDERVPPVEPGTACSLDEVVQKAGMRVEEFITNVDRFAASEFLKH